MTPGTKAGLVIWAITCLGFAIWLITDTRKG